MKKVHHRNLFNLSGIYLDTLRIFAAFIVVIYHAYYHVPSNTNDDLNSVRFLLILKEAGHAAVIVFFALSGFVIAHTTVSNNRGIGQYAQARLSRLYSILIPSLFITAIVQLIIFFTNPVLFAYYSRGLSLIRYILAVSFTNQLWFISSEPPINGPLWSLSYEFWYYTIFGLWLFSKGRYKFILPFIASLVAGPKILLLMPVWIAGCIAYQLPRPILSITLSWIFIALSLFTALLCLVYIPRPFEVGQAPLFYSAQFFRDNACGLFIALSLWFLPNGTKRISKPSCFYLVRLVADLTFPLYLLHQPLLILVRSLFPSASFWLITLVAITSSMMIGYILNKQRPLWATLFARYFKIQSIKEFFYVRLSQI